MNISKFSFSELFSNNSGKTSASAFSGVFLCLTGGTAFIYGCILKNSEIITNSVMVITIGSTLIFGRKIIDGKLPIQNAEQSEGTDNSTDKTDGSEQSEPTDNSQTSTD